MLQTVSYEREPAPIRIEHRKSGVSDLWLRKDAAAPATEEESWTAQEAYMTLLTPDCPTESEITVNFDTWFDYAAAWQPEKQKTLAQLQADIDYIAAMCGIDLEG
jgi:hypothetical protein